MPRDSLFLRQASVFGAMLAHINIQKNVMRVYLCEKPSQGKDIACLLGFH
jgi:hypothetical protein